MGNKNVTCLDLWGGKMTEDPLWWIIAHDDISTQSDKHHTSHPHKNLCLNTTLTLLVPFAKIGDQFQQLGLNSGAFEV